MAAPATTVRQTPAGRLLKEGFPIKVAFARDPDIEFAEKAVKPPAIDGGETIDITTMFNTLVRTSYPRTLHTIGPITGRVAYDPLVYSKIRSNLINQNGSITVRFPEGSTLDFYGYLQMFDPQDQVEGQQPEATISIVVTNWDSTNNIEVGPVYTDVSGT